MSFFNNIWFYSLRYKKNVAKNSKLCDDQILFLFSLPLSCMIFYKLKEQEYNAGNSKIIKANPMYGPSFLNKNSPLKGVYGKRLPGCNYFSKNRRTENLITKSAYYLWHSYIYLLIYLWTRYQLKWFSYKKQINEISLSSPFLLLLLFSPSNTDKYR